MVINPGEADPLLIFRIYYRARKEADLMKSYYETVAEKELPRYHVVEQPYDKEQKCCPLKVVDLEAEYGKGFRKKLKFMHKNGYLYVGDGNSQYFLSMLCWTNELGKARKYTETFNKIRRHEA